MRYDMDNTAMQDIYPDVFLDGVKVQDWIEADTTEGWVMRHKRGWHAEWSRLRGGLPTEVMHGVVTVDLVPMGTEFAKLST